jgi:hypothetical protein
MELKFVIFLCFSIFITVNCEFDAQDIIDKTRNLQDIEKYGIKYINPSPNSVYPQLSNLTDATHRSNFNQTLNGTGVDTLSQSRNNNSSGVQPLSFNSTERFLNKTISGMSKGVCIKEVP